MNKYARAVCAHALWSSILLAPRSAGADATYDVRFDATWSATTHPDAFPAGAHFSPIVGATHGSSMQFWAVGSTATPGIERMAELGQNNILRDEILAVVDDPSQYLIGSGFNSPGSTTLEFDVNAANSLVTLVTMVAPSPDWFVGVSGLDLRPGGVWQEEIVVELHTYDAGTDSGSNFTSPNLNTIPQEPIALLGDPLGNTPALGTFTFTLLSVPEPNSLALLALGLLTMGRIRRTAASPAERFCFFRSR